MPAQASLQQSTPSLTERIALKIQQGQENVLTEELEQLRSMLHDDKSIPFLDRNYLQSGNIPPDAGRVTLVRYRGMVQDMLDSEFYVSEMNSVKTKYRDYCGVDNVGGMQDITQHLEERQLLVVVPVPFSACTKTIGTESNDQPAQLSNTAAEPARGNKNKRALEETNQDESSRKQHQPALIGDSPERSSSFMSNLDWWPAGCMGSDPQQCPVLAKMYYQDKQEQLKLNQVVDMIGVLSVNPLDAAASVHDNDDDMMMICDTNVIPPPSLLPRLHVLCYNPIDIYDIMKCSDDTAMMDTTAMMDRDAMDDRTFCLQTLSKLLGGNDTAAEALLLVLLSMAERQPIKGTWSPIQMTENTTLGCASIQLVLPTQEACNELQKALHQVLAQVVPVVSSTTYQSLVAAPCKNDAGRLEPSILQLPKGAVLLMNQQHVVSDSAAAVSLALTKSHVVPYIFEGGMSYNFEADISAILLSCGTCSNNTTLTMSLKETAASSTSMSLTEYEVWRIRSYIQACRRPSPHGAHNVELDRTVLNVAQQDFVKQRVQQRQSNSQESNEQDFHRWLTLTRLEARSRVGDGKNDSHSATVDDWKAALRLDHAMRKVQ